MSTTPHTANTDTAITMALSTPRVVGSIIFVHIFVKRKELH
jgi:hypothetical protein